MDWRTPIRGWVSCKSVIAAKKSGNHAARGPQTGMAGPPQFQPLSAPDCVTMPDITAVKALAEGQATPRIREKAHAVQGFAEIAAGQQQRRAMAGAGRS